MESEADLTPKMNWPGREREREGGGLDLVGNGHFIGRQTSKGPADRRFADIFNPAKVFFLPPFSSLKGMREGNLVAEVTFEFLFHQNQ